LAVFKLVGDGVIQFFPRCKNIYQEGKYSSLAAAAGAKEGEM